MVELIKGEKNHFTDYYGPFFLKKEKTFIFAQQFKYDPARYFGDYLVKTKIIKGGLTIVKNEFEVTLGKLDTKLPIKKKIDKPLIKKLTPKESSVQKSTSLSTSKKPLVGKAITKPVDIKPVQPTNTKTIVEKIKHRGD